MAIEGYYKANIIYKLLSRKFYKLAAEQNYPLIPGNCSDYSTMNYGNMEVKTNFFK